MITMEQSNFNLFLQNLKKALASPLPGQEAHNNLAPEHRKELMFLEPDLSKAQPSSVLLLFFPDKQGEPRLVFTKRVEYKGVHSGQISFPGGKAEKADKDIYDTAYRETEEEIGVFRNQINTIGTLSELYVPPSNFMIFPVIGAMDKEPVFNIDRNEVAEVITVPFSFFTNDKAVGNYTVVTSDMMALPVPGFMVNGHLIWGATAMILSELVTVMRGFTQ